ncbi:MAG: hypothetical protein DRN92_02915 [Thermoproteota archaeon]|nr:MAG: hypothetical protein DRN92_02915 [Candidatus Korarchaeota archaeon]
MRWYLKFVLQRTLSVIPWGPRINCFFQEHFGELRSVDIGERVREIKELFIVPIVERYGFASNLKVVEIGTGWVPVLPILLSLLGNECKSFDVVRWLNVRRFKNTLNSIIKCLHYLNDIPGFSLNDAMRRYEQIIATENLKLQNLGWTYIAPIDTTHLPLKDNSQDIVVSRLVLEHIPQSVLPSVVKETWRILRPGGLAIHKINLHDEYAQVDPKVTLINFLKFPSWFWNLFINNRIKFVNQSRYPYYLKLFKDTGFQILKVRKKIDERSYKALSTMKIAREFRKYSKEELATIGITVVLEKWEKS